MERAFQVVSSQRLAGGTGPWLGVILVGGQERCICADVVAWEGRKEGKWASEVLPIFWKNMSKRKQKMM